MRSGMLRYARYQAGDFLLQKASVPAILALFIGGLTVYLASHRSVPIDWSAPLGADNARAVLKQALDLFVPLAAFLAVNGISSGDRQRGYVRFLFAKPIVVPAYYVQTWLVYGGMLALLAGALTMLLQLFTTALPVGGAMAAAGRGSIINIGSLYASVSPDQRFYDHLAGDLPFLKSPAYGASKAGVVNMTKYFSTLWGPSGVRVNTLSPGGVLGGQDDLGAEAVRLAPDPRALEAAVRIVAGAVGDDDLLRARLERELHDRADDVGVRVHEQTRVREDALEFTGDDIVVDRNDRSGWLAVHDFLREVRSGENRCGVPRQLVGHHFGHALARVALETLGQTHDGHPCPYERCSLAQHLAEALRRHRHHHDVGIAHHFFEIARCPQFGWQFALSQIRGIAMRRIDGRRRVGIARPQESGRIDRRHRGHRGSPRSGSDDAHTNRHAASVFRRQPHVGFARGFVGCARGAAQIIRQRKRPPCLDSRPRATRTALQRVRRTGCRCSR